MFIWFHLDYELWKTRISFSFHLLPLNTHAWSNIPDALVIFRRWLRFRYNSNISIFANYFIAFCCRLRKAEPAKPSSHIEVERFRLQWVFCDSARAAVLSFCNANLNDSSRSHRLYSILSIPIIYSIVTNVLQRIRHSNILTADGKESKSRGRLYPLLRQRRLSLWLPIRSDRCQTETLICSSSSRELSQLLASECSTQSNKWISFNQTTD